MILLLDFHSGLTVSGQVFIDKNITHKGCMLRVEGGESLCSAEKQNN